MKKVQFQVDGLINNTCKTQVKNALDKVEGIQKVSISLTAGTVQVEYNEPADKRKISDCIVDTGFSIVS